LVLIACGPECSKPDTDVDSGFSGENSTSIGGVFPFDYGKAGSGPSPC